MAERILLVNPSPRKKPRSAKQKAATKKLIALNKAKRKSLTKPKTRAKPKRKKVMAKARRTPAQKAATRKLVAFNKSRRKKPGVGRKRKAYTSVRTTTASKPRRRKARRPVAAPARRVIRRRRNPVTTKGIMNKTVMPAVTAASGALALDVAWAYLPIPANIKAGPMRHLAKGLGAVGLGVLAGTVLTKKKADEMATGALTVVLHQAARDLIAQNVPAIKMDGMGYYNAGYPAGGPENMGLYVADQPAPMNTGMYVGNAESESAYYGQH